MRDEIIENLFVLNYWAYECGCKNFKINQFNYDYFVEGINFRIIKDLLIVDGDYFEDDYQKIFNGIVGIALEDFK